MTLQYACQTTSGGCSNWFVQQVDVSYNTGAYSSLAFNSYNQPYISYYDASQGALKIATQQGNYWDIHTIDDGSKDIGRYTNLAIDKDDRVHVTYQNTTDYSIWYALGR
jgi:hypothetical protein